VIPELAQLTGRERFFIGGGLEHRLAVGGRVVVDWRFNVPAAFFSLHTGDSGRKGRMTISGTMPISVVK